MATQLSIEWFRMLIIPYSLLLRLLPLHHRVGDSSSKTIVNLMDLLNEMMMTLIPEVEENQVSIITIMVGLGTTTIIFLLQVIITIMLTTLLPILKLWLQCQEDLFHTDTILIPFTCILVEPMSLDQNMLLRVSLSLPRFDTFTLFVLKIFFFFSSSFIIKLYTFTFYFIPVLRYSTAKFFHILPPLILNLIYCLEFFSLLSLSRSLDLSAVPLSLSFLTSKQSFCLYYLSIF